MIGSTNAGNFISNSGTIGGNVTQTQGAADGKRSVGVDKMGHQMQTFSYDVAISYASEQTHFVSRVAKLLEADGFSVFFAPTKEEEFVGEDMITSFYRIYRYESRYVAAFVSEEYLKKDITMHEATTAIMRKKDEKRNCLIPICFGTARLKCLDLDINYISADGLREVEVADKIRSILLVL